MFKKRLSVCLAAVIAAGSFATACAEVKLDSCFGSNMVLQRELPARIRGTAAPGEKVTVKFAGQTVEATADDRGDWTATFAPLEASKEPRQLTAAGADNTVTLDNVLVGEVWLCTGQSNMQYALYSANPLNLHTDSEKITAQADHPLIRIAAVPLVFAADPQRQTKMSWQAVTPQNIKGFSAVGYFFGVELQKELDVPVGLVRSCWGGTRIEPWTNLAGFESVPEGAKLARFLRGRTGGTEEYRRNAGRFSDAMNKWRAAVDAALAKGQVPPPPPELPGDFVAPDRKVPGALYNAMIHPLTGMTVRGAIWYQGEANLHQWYDYRWQMHALLNGWKQAFANPDFQFHFVQIAPWRYNAAMPRTCIGLWEAQRKFADESGCGMAVVNDYGDADNIHPHDKRPVGHRLALLALNRTYGRKDIVCDAPRVTSAKFGDGQVVLEFSNASRWSTTDGGAPSGFEVAGIDGEYFPAAARIDGARIVAASERVPEPRYVRYLCRNVAIGNLHSEYGLVPGPFRTGNVSQDELFAYLTGRENLVYEYDLLAGGRRGIKPRVDNSAKFSGRTVGRVRYLFVAKDKKGRTQYAEISLDPFVQDLRKLAVPGSKIRHNIATPVRNIRIRTNSPVLIDGDEMNNGTVEFFFSNYGPKNVKNIRGANDKVFDAGDQPTINAKSSYGCMQIHDPRGNAIVCYNGFALGRRADFGFGRCPGKNPDWTFSHAAANCSSLKLYVFCDFE